MREQTAEAINGNGELPAAEFKPVQAVLPPAKISDPAHTGHGREGTGEIGL